jgi:conjugal transfer pilus assembly protein TraL
MNERQLMFKTLDNPTRLLFWTIDEFLVMATPIFLGLCFGSIILIFLAAILKPCHSKIKKKLPYGTLKHLLYWHLPTASLKKMGRVKRLPSSHLRELLL